MLWETNFYFNKLCVSKCHSPPVGTERVRRDDGVCNEAHIVTAGVCGTGRRRELDSLLNKPLTEELELFEPRLWPGFATHEYSVVHRQENLLFHMITMQRGCHLLSSTTILKNIS